MIMNKMILMKAINFNQEIIYSNHNKFNNILIKINIKIYKNHINNNSKKKKIIYIYIIL